LTRFQIHTSDFEKFDFIFAMDRDNRKTSLATIQSPLPPKANATTNPKNHAVHDLQYIQRRVGSKARAKVMLFGDFSGRKHSEEISDPYYGARDGFEVAYEQCLRFSKNFLTQTFPHAKP
jgi:low molecular weight phosphotyrosine protein phosphatase